MSRRNRMYRDFTIDEEDPAAKQDPRASLPSSPQDTHPPQPASQTQEQDHFYHDRSLSRATAETVVTQIRAAPPPQDAVPGVADDYIDDDQDVQARPIATGNKPGVSNGPGAPNGYSGHAYKASVVRTESQRRNLRNFNWDVDIPTSHSSYADSVASMPMSQAPSQASGLTSGSASRLPDFFSHEIFQTVLHNPTTSHQLLLFSKSRMCGENMEYLEKIHRYHDLLNEVTRNMFEVHKDFLSPGGANQINISESLLLQIRKDMKHTLTVMLPRLETLFDDCTTEIERLVATDIYPRFVRHQMIISASKALGSDRTKYAGLGDCFVLTNPTKADNPILYASDGFVKVTGYTRNEIIPRNCRFLQGRQTDRRAVKRLRMSIEHGQESVELLLNYKKNGEPFWNLLYVTPLYDFEGRLAFFLGGQINCSTTIHNASDILRILASTEDEAEEDQSPENRQATTPKSESGGFFKRFRQSKPAAPPRAPGMESGLLNRIEKLNLSSQMTEFYTAYSKFIIVNAVTHYISFHSYGIISLLYPVKPSKSGEIPGVIPDNINVVQPRRVMPPGSPIAAAAVAAAVTKSPVGSQSQTQIQQALQQQALSSASPVHSVAGHDIFKFLTQHTLNNLSREYKAAVKNTMKTGNPVTLELMLCTRRRMGFEKFLTHWTPLKDEMGRTEFVVLTLGSAE